MIKFIDPTEEQKEYSRNLMKKRFEYERQNSGTYLEKLFGFLGQVIVCDLMKKERPTDISKKDGLFDIEFNGKKYDVKVRQINVPNKKEYWNSIPEEQINYTVDGYIFLVYRTDKGQYQIVGWMEKKEFTQKCKYHKVGDRPNLKFNAYEIQDQDLKRFSTLNKTP